MRLYLENQSEGSDTDYILVELIKAHFLKGNQLIHIFGKSDGGRIVPKYEFVVHYAFFYIK